MSTRKRLYAFACRPHLLRNGISASFARLHYAFAGYSLDHASRLPNYGSKMGIDATRKWTTEGFTRPWPPMLQQDPAVAARIDALWKKLGIA